MPSVDVIDLSNKKVGTLELADAVFGAPVNKALLYEAVRHHLAAPRQQEHAFQLGRTIRRREFNQLRGNQVVLLDTACLPERRAATAHSAQ